MRLKRTIAPSARALPALGDLREIIDEFVFFDDQEMILIGLDQAEIMKPLHKQTDPRPGRADHLGEFFVGNLELDANTARIFLAHRARQL